MIPAGLRRLLLATTVIPVATGAAQPNPLMSLLPLIILFVVFWFLLLRPQMKRAKEHRELLSKLQKGDEVITQGGITRTRNRALPGIAALRSEAPIRPTISFRLTARTIQ